MEEYERLNANERDASDEERLTVERRKAEQQAMLRQQESDTNERTETLNRRRSQLETEFQGRRNQLQMREQEALQRTRQAADRRGNLRAEVIFIDGDLVRLDLQIQAEPDPLIRTALIQQYNQLIVIRRNRVLELRHQDLAFSRPNANSCWLRQKSAIPLGNTATRWPTCRDHDVNWRNNAPGCNAN